MVSASERPRLCFWGLKKIGMISDVVDLFGIVLHWARRGSYVPSRTTFQHSHLVPWLDGAIHSLRPGHGM